MKKGFTLIELLAVIVILAIIALIATPVVLNIINDSRESSSLRSAEMYLRAVEYSVANAALKNKIVKDGTYSITNDGNICLDNKTRSVCLNENKLVVEVDGEKPTEGTITIANGNIGNVVLKLNNQTITKNNNGELVYLTSPCILIDKDGDGIASLSDEITCSGEEFYVMENNDNIITMLAKYNLNVGVYSDCSQPICNPANIENPTGLQDEKSIYTDATNYNGVTWFATTNYWFSDGTFIIDTNYKESGRDYPYIYGEFPSNGIYSYVENYETYLKNNGVSSANASLISYEQVNDLKSNKGNPNWLYTVEYYTGSAEYLDFVKTVNTNGGFSNLHYYNDGPRGVRPIVTISIDEI